MESVLGRVHTYLQHSSVPILLYSIYAAMMSNLNSKFNSAASSQSANLPHTVAAAGAAAPHSSPPTLPPDLDVPSIAALVWRDLMNASAVAPPQGIAPYYDAVYQNKTLVVAATSTSKPKYNYYDF